MAISKVVYGEETLIDLTEDTVDADSLALGISAHLSNGEPIVGLAPKTWTGTKAQYEAEKSGIPVGTIVNITDDYEEGGEPIALDSSWELIGEYDLSTNATIPELSQYDEFYIVAKDLDIMYTYFLRNKSSRLTMGAYNNSSVSVLYLGTIDWTTNKITCDAYIHNVWSTNNIYKFYGRKNGVVVPVKDVYSEEERVIGTWFGKTLYRKVITKSNLALPSYSSASIDVNLTSDIGTNRVQIIKANVTVYDSSSGQWASVACQIAHTVGTDSYKIKCLDSWGASSGRYVYFILEYTKG